MSSKCKACHNNRKNKPAPWAKCLQMAHSSDCPACPLVNASDICKKFNLVSNNVLSKHSFQNSSKMKTSRLIGRGSGRMWKTTTWKKFVQDRDDTHCFPTITINSLQNGRDAALHLYFYSNIKCRIWFFILGNNYEKDVKKTWFELNGKSMDETPITREMLINATIKVMNPRRPPDPSGILLGEYYKLSEAHDWKINDIEQTGGLTTVLEGNVSTHITIGHQPFNHEVFSCDDNKLTIYYVTQGIDNKVRHPRTRILRVIKPQLTTPLYKHDFLFKRYKYLYDNVTRWNTLDEKGCISGINFYKVGWDNSNNHDHNIIGENSSSTLNLDMFNYVNESDNQPSYGTNKGNFDSLENIQIHMNNITTLKNSIYTHSQSPPWPASNDKYDRTILKGLKTIKINEPSKLKTIDISCCKGFTALETVEIITSARELTIGESAFQDCSGLKTITISLTNDSPSIIIKEGAFKNTTLLDYVYITSTNKKKITISLGERVFEDSGLIYIGTGPQ